MTDIYVPHSFFDPSSRYNRLRASCDPREKLLGYFDLLRYEREHQSQKVEAEPLAAAPAPIVVRLDEPQRSVRPERLVWPQAPELENRFYVQLQLAEQDRPVRDTRCRILLMPSKAIERLRETCVAEGIELSFHQERAIQQLLTEEILENSFEVCRVLSALPELEGQVTHGGRVFAEEAVPFRSPNVPPDTWIVVVYEPPRVKRG